MLPMTWIARTVPFTFGFHATSVPFAMLNAATWFRVTSCEPAGAPGGRTAVNWPPMYTRFLLDHDHVDAAVRLPRRRRHGRHDRERRRADRKPAHSHSGGHCSRPHYPSPHQPPREVESDSPVQGTAGTRQVKQAPASPGRWMPFNGRARILGRWSPPSSSIRPARFATPARRSRRPSRRSVRSAGAGLAGCPAGGTRRGVAGRHHGAEPGRARVDRLERRRGRSPRTDDMGQDDGPRHRANRLADRDRRDDSGLRRARGDAPSALAQTGSLTTPSRGARDIAIVAVGGVSPNPPTVLHGSQITGSHDPRSQRSIVAVTGDDRSRGSGVRSEHTNTQSRRRGAGRRCVSGGRRRGNGRPRTLGERVDDHRPRRRRRAPADRARRPPPRAPRPHRPHRPHRTTTRHRRGFVA